MAVQYDAFISYRHAELDSKVASEIQKKLERAQIPRGIQKKTGKMKIGRIFRDKEELPITSDINDDITEALRNSEYLIVICSTSTRESVWVQREIDEFLKYHDPNHVLTVLASGEPQDVIPERLRYKEVEAVGEDGTRIKTRIAVEPLSCDYRDPSAKVRREELPRLLAVIMGCSYDDLRQRQRRRKLQQLLAVFLAVLTLVSGIAVYALDRAHRIAQQAEIISAQAEQIEAEYRNTLIAQSRYLAQVSEELLNSGDREAAIQVALEALPEGESDNSRPVVDEALYALNNTLYTYRIATYHRFVPVRKLSNPGYYYGWSEASPTGKRWMTGNYNSFCVYDLEDMCCVVKWSGSEVQEYTGYDWVSGAYFLSDDRIVIYNITGLYCWDTGLGEMVWQIEISESGTVAVDTERNELLYIWEPLLEQRTVIQRYDGETGKLLGETSLDFVKVNHAAETYGTATGEYVAIGSEYYDGTADVLVAGLNTGEYFCAETEYAEIGKLYCPDEETVVVLSYEGSAEYQSGSRQYAVECFSMVSGEKMWSVLDEVYLNRDMDDYTEVSMGILNTELDYGMGNEDCLLVYLGRALLVLSPDNGEILSRVEFSSEILTMDPYGTDRVFLSFRDGTISQYIFDIESQDEMGTVSGNIVAAVYCEDAGIYAVLLEDQKTIVFMSKQVEDANGKKISGENAVGTVGYISDGVTEYRVIERYKYDEAGELVYWDSFYKLHETEPVAVTVQYRHGGGGMELARTDNETVAYWISKDDEKLYLMGWSLNYDELYCKHVVESEYNYSAELVTVIDGTAVIQIDEGVALVDLSTGKQQTIEEEGYLNDVLVNEGNKAMLLVENDSERGSIMRMIQYPSLTEMEIPEITAELLETSSYPNAMFSPGGKYLVITCAGQYAVLDGKTLEFIRWIPVSCTKNRSMAFYSDDILLVIGDSGQLSSWNVSDGSLVMEDRFVHVEGQVYVDNGTCYTYDWQETFVATTHWYSVEENGFFARGFSVRNGEVSADGTEVVSIFSTDVNVYQSYGLDELIEKARQVIGEERLSEIERRKYYIDG